MIEITHDELLVSFDKMKFSASASVGGFAVRKSLVFVEGTNDGNLTVLST
jgi:hypothetical protein